MNSPQLENGYTKIANEIMKALCQVNLSPYESRLVWAIFRKTYGYHKKEDWISNSQLIEITGLPKGSVSKAKARLIKRKIVTRTGNKIAFNKYYMQWDELPIEVTPKKLPVEKPKLPLRKPELPVERDTKETTTKENIQKKDFNVLEKEFKRISIENEWCDDHYAEKTWQQGTSLLERNEFIRKVNLMVSWSRIQSKKKSAEILFHEIAGFVNDKQFSPK